MEIQLNPTKATNWAIVSLNYQFSIKFLQHQITKSKNLKETFF